MYNVIDIIKMLKSMSIYQNDNKWIAKFNISTSCLVFMGLIPTCTISKPIKPRILLHYLCLIVVRGLLNNMCTLGESFEAIPKQHEIDFVYHKDEIMSDKDEDQQKKAINVVTKFMYSNKIWKLIETSKEIKPIEYKQAYRMEKKSRQKY